VPANGVLITILWRIPDPDLTWVVAPVEMYA
jgi:hypothetical protein